MAVEHANVTDPNIHEPKGAATANANEVYRANGAGGGNWLPGGNTRTGTYLYEDTATTGTPIALVAAATDYPLTNDSLGALTTSEYGIAGVEIWDSTTNQLDFTGLAPGDTFELRLTGTFVSSAANHAVSLTLELATGTGSEILIPLITKANFKSAGSNEISTYEGFFIGSAFVRDNPGRILARSDNTGDTFIVDEFLFNVHKRLY